MCKKHHNDYDKMNLDLEIDINYKTEQFIKEVINPSGSQYLDILLKELR
jgi:hypothetical protein